MIPLALRPRILMAFPDNGLWYDRVPMFRTRASIASVTSCRGGGDGGLETLMYSGQGRIYAQMIEPLSDKPIHAIVR